MADEQKVCNFIVETKLREGLKQATMYCEKPDPKGHAQNIRI